jgi:hypothetical protein
VNRAITPAALLVLGFLLLSTWRDGSPWPVTPDGPVAEAKVPAPPPPEKTAPSPPLRDVFRYGEANPPPFAAPPPPGKPKTVSAAKDTSPEAPPPPAPPVRLVGLVRKPGGWRAAVAGPAGVAIVAPGDVIEGLTVLGIDDDRGLRLRAPDGSEIALVPGG